VSDAVTNGRGKGGNDFCRLRAKSPERSGVTLFYFSFFLHYNYASHIMSFLGKFFQGLLAGDLFCCFG